MTWQTMETAPKDGTEVDLYGKVYDRIVNARFKNGRWEHWWCDSTDGFGWIAVPEEPTHWMPCPESPK